MPSTTRRDHARPPMSATRRVGETHRRAGHLIGDLAAAHVGQVVDGDRHGRQDVELLALRRARLEAALELLGDEAGGKPPFAPARMLHERGQEGNVVLDPVDDEGIQRIGLQVDRRLARGRMRDQLGDHGIVVHGDLGAFEHAGVVAHGARRWRTPPGAADTG